MAFTKSEKVHAIIHTAAVTAAGIGGGMAQVPMSDSLLLVPLQMGMITAIALVHGRKITEATATAVLGTLGATMFGRALSQVLIGWMPVVGNTLNASTAAGLTEAVGWSAHKFFEQLGEEPLTDEEVADRAKQHRK